MSKTLAIALAYVGVIVGAGFASGQEVMQYFVAFGSFKGGLALILAAFLFITTAKCLLELGSLYNAKGHDQVLNAIVPSALAKLLDVSFIVGNFGIGLVMIAGAGTNLNQQFGLPIWVGAVLVSVLIILAGFLDTERVTEIIGTITPFLVLFFVIVAVYCLMNVSKTLDELNTIATTQVMTTLPNWFMAAINYVTFNLMTGVSMAMVMGGDELEIKAAGKGGLGGGTIIAILLCFSAGAIFSQIHLLYDAGMPMLELVNQINPILGVIMSFVILGMIFNTGLGMFYAVSSRIVKHDEKKFRMVLIGLVAVAFVASFLGFENLVAYLYPAIGYVGILLLVVLYYGWFKSRSLIKKEDELRAQMIDLVMSRHYNPGEVRKLMDQSVVDNEDLKEAIKIAVQRKLRGKKDLDQEDQVDL